MTTSRIDNEKGDNEPIKSKSDFSIEHILNRAGKSVSNNSYVQINENNEIAPNSRVGILPLPWMKCTRYCPPKIPRNQRKDGPQKRQLGRHPRIPFTSHQLSILEDKFQKSPYLSSAEVTQISRSLQLADIRVKIWFQNRRARERRERVNIEGLRQPHNSSASSTKEETSRSTIATATLENGSAEEQYSTSVSQARKHSNNFRINSGTTTPETTFLSNIALQACSLGYISQLLDFRSNASS